MVAGLACFLHSHFLSIICFCENIIVLLLHAGLCKIAIWLYPEAKSYNSPLGLCKSSNESEISEDAQFVCVWGCISCIPVFLSLLHILSHTYIYTSLLRPTEYKGPRLVLCAHIKVSHSRRSSKGQTTHMFHRQFSQQLLNMWKQNLCVFEMEGFISSHVSLHLSPAELSWIHSWTQHFVHLCWKYLHW